MKITCKDKTFNVESNTRIKDALKNEIENSENKIITCICNNKVKSLNHRVHEDSNIELLDYTNKEGKRVYVRGALYIMAKAFKEEYPEAKLTVNYQLSNSIILNTCIKKFKLSTECDLRYFRNYYLILWKEFIY